MGQQFGTSRNTTDVIAMSDTVALNATTATALAVASRSRIHFEVQNNDASIAIWLKFQAAAVDNDKKGFLLAPGGFWRMPSNNVYSGALSAVSASGTPDVFVLEY